MAARRKSHIRSGVAAASVAALIALAPQVSTAADPGWIARSRDGMVAADHVEASEAGAAVLRDGGNAFDAAVATSLALAVCRPESTGLGGGGFMVAYVAAAKQFVVLDFRETAPASATPERYAKLAAERAAAAAAGRTETWSASIYGGNAVAVPGLVAGLAEINHRFGSRPWADLFAPAIALADRGFTVDQTYRGACAGVLEDLAKWPDLKPLSASLTTGILRVGAPPAPGTRHPRPSLATALRRIAADGPAVFYGGPIGEAITATVTAAGGGMTLADLRAYRVREREPLQFTCRDFDLVTVPPPSSGGICLAQALNTLAGFSSACGMPDGHAAGAGGSEADRVNAGLLVESLKHAFANRARWLGDPDFSDTPTALFLRSHYAEEIRNRMRAAGGRPQADPSVYGSTTLPDTLLPAGAGQPPDDRGTSHFCVADRFGNIVSMTETINGTFGSYLVAEPFGIILNNEMDDFTTVEGQPNLFGLTQSARNLVAPGKRPLSSMTPTIVFRNGPAGPRPFLAIGASGGPRIITNALQVAQRLMQGASPETAMTAPRLHHQWQPDELYLDRDPPDERWREIVESLRANGHHVSDKRRGASVQFILFDQDGTLTGACDPKKGGRPAGP